MGIIDDYFDGYYSEEMIESQVLIHVQSPLSVSSSFHSLIDVSKE